MICPTCKAETDGVNHNNRGRRCTACWALLPVPIAEDTILVRSAAEMEAGLIEAGPVKRTRKPRKKTGE